MHSLWMVTWLLALPLLVDLPLVVVVVVVQFHGLLDCKSCFAHV